MQLPVSPRPRRVPHRSVARLKDDKHRRARAMLAIVLLALTLSAAGAPAIDGSWVLNEDASIDPDDAFDDMLRRDAYPVPYIEPGPGEATSSRDASQTEYWETVRKGKESHSLKNLQRLGAAYPLVIAERVDIRTVGNGFEIVYDEALPRDLQINPKGRVFSASGDELTHDTIGFTIAYWDQDVLALETDLPEGGKVYERFRVYDNPRQLEYMIKLEMRVLKEPVEFKRLLVPAGSDE